MTTPTPTHKVHLALAAARKHGLTVRLDARGRVLVQPKAALRQLPGVAAILQRYPQTVRAVMHSTEAIHG